MPDINDLINLILRDTKAKNQNTVSEKKTYQDEPILITASQMKNYTPPKYREMRKLYNSNSYGRDTRLFYEQGKFMETFEDNFDYHGLFNHYYPTYQAMNDLQLRGYFSWRTKVRNGTVEETSTSFAFVYIYELINQIGVDSPIDGFLKINDFWRNYQAYNDQLDRYVTIWLTDYVVYYGLDKSLLDGIVDTKPDFSLKVLQQYQLHSQEEVFEAICARSTYKLQNSRFYKAYPEDVKAVVCRVYAALAKHYNKKEENYICDRLFGTKEKELHFMFRSAVFYEQHKHADVVYKLSDHRKYMHEHGQWICEHFFWYGNRNKKVSGLLKNIDCHMRLQYDYKYPIKEEKSLKLFLRNIDREIELFLEEKKVITPIKPAIVEVKIDLSKLQGIRKAALETQNKLIVDEEDLAVKEEIPVLKEHPEEKINLGDAEYQLLQCLIYEKPYVDFLGAKGLMLSVLVDTINEVFFDRFGDTVIVCDEDHPELIEDYVDELKGIIKE